MLRISCPEMIEDPFRLLEGEAGYRGELGYRGGSHTSQTAEALQQAPSFGGPHARYAQELRGNCSLSSPFPVIGQPEAVGFVPCSL